MVNMHRSLAVRRTRKLARLVVVRCEQSTVSSAANQCVHSAVGRDFVSLRCTTMHFTCVHANLTASVRLWVTGAVMGVNSMRTHGWRHSVEGAYWSSPFGSIERLGAVLNCVVLGAGLRRACRPGNVANGMRCAPLRLFTAVHRTHVIRSSDYLTH